MSLRVKFGGAPASLGGAGATVEVRHAQHALGTNVFPGTGGWTDGGTVRYAGQIATLPGVNGWANGSGGATPSRGYGTANGTGWKQGRNTAAGNVPIDWYCGVMPSPLTEKPPVLLPASPFAVWEFGALMKLSAVPAANITRDCGMVLVMSANTSFANCLRAGAVAGNEFAGFGVVFDALGDLLWIAKKNGAGGGSALSESLKIARGTSQRINAVKIRIYDATVGVDARVEVYLDGVLTLTRSWGAGTVLPVAADATFQASMGTFRPMLRMAQETTANVFLQFRDEYIKAAATAALLD